MSKPKIDLASELLFHRKLSLRLERLIGDGMERSSDIKLQDLFCFGLFIQATRSFKAVRTLVNDGFFEDAFSIVRSMVEKVINGAYIRHLDEDSAGDFMDFTTFKRWRDYESFVGSLPNLARIFPGDSISKMKSQFDRLCVEKKSGRFGRGCDWTHLGLRARAEYIDHNITLSGHASEVLNARFIYQFCYMESAPFVHGLFPSIQTLFKVTKRKKILKENEPVIAKVIVALRNSDPHLAKDALACSNFTALYLLLLADRLFHESKHYKNILALAANYGSNSEKLSARELISI